jgi:hypothetical protein
MLAAVDLNQLAKMFAPKARLMKLTTLLARQPQPVFGHPFAQRLPRDNQAMAFEEHLARKGRPKVAIAFGDIGER